MKTAVNALVALAAVFFSISVFASTNRFYYGSDSSAQSACFSKAASFGISGGGCENPSVGLSDPSFLPPGWSHGAGYFLSHGYYDSNMTWTVDEYFFYFPTNFACPDGEVVNELTGLCELPPPEVDCSKEAGKHVLVKLAGDATSWCHPVIQFADPDAGMDPSNLVDGACNVAVDVTSEKWTTTPAGEVLVEGVYTGDACGTPQPEIVPPAVPEDNYPTQACVTGASGTVVCKDTEMPKNCGTLNGEMVCVDDAPAGNCTFFAGGNWICDADAPTPPKPAVPPEIVGNGRGPDGQPQTVQVFPPGAEGGDSGSTYTGGGRSAAGEDGDGMACGGEGQPPCKIDETGTPEFDASELTDPADIINDQISTVEGLTGQEAGSDDSTSDVRSAIESALPGSGDCSPIVLDFKGYTTSLDGGTRFAFVREGLSWVFGLFAAFTVFAVLTKGNK